jgi:hypothetical protein
MTATFPVGTVVDLALEALGVRVHTKGEVRVSYPFLGMGIKFKEIADEEKSALQELLQRLSGGGLMIPRQKKTSTTGIEDLALPTFAEAGEVVKELGHFFEAHSSLSREEFFALLRKRAENR